MPNHSNLTPAERRRLAYLGGLTDTAALHAQVDDNTTSIETLEEENYELEQKIEQLEYALQCANEEVEHLARQLLRYEG